MFNDDCRLGAIAIRLEHQRLIFRLGTRRNRWHLSRMVCLKDQKF